MKRLIKCRFCSLVKEFESEIFRHIEIAHKDKVIEELFLEEK